MPGLNIAIVAGRRPDLLERTLLSFDRHLFSFCTIGQVRVNLDPIFGTEADAAAAVTLLRDLFPQAEIHQPATPGFGWAVRWLWSGMADGPFLHLEDDWICLEDIRPEEALSKFAPDVGMVSLRTEQHGPRGDRDASTRFEKTKLLGLTVKRTEVPAFNTSPGFVDGAFARQVAALFDPALDPEKQMREQFNPPLKRFLADWRCLFHKSLSGQPIIEDIGRGWQQAHGVEKRTEGGVSIWTDTGTDTGTDSR